MKIINEMMKIIQKQFETIMSSDPEYYGSCKIILSNEQQFVKDKDRDTNAVYIVVKFLAGSLNYGQTLMPVNFNALGQGNRVDLVQRLLLEYAQTFNLGDEETVTEQVNNVTHKYIIKQVYTQPQVMSNFNETWNEFRNLFFMTGTFLVGKDSLPITAIEYFSQMPVNDGEKGEEISFITSTWSFDIQLDTQAFYGTNSRTESKSRQGTLVLNIASYFTNNALCDLVRAIAFNDVNLAPSGVRTTFYLRVTFSDGKKSTLSYKLANASTIQNIGEFPLINMTFTN